MIKVRTSREYVQEALSQVSPEVFEPRYICKPAALTSHEYLGMRLGWYGMPPPEPISELVTLKLLLKPFLDQSLLLVCTILHIMLDSLWRLLQALGISLIPRPPTSFTVQLILPRLSLSQPKN